MAFTQAQLNAILSISSTANLITGAAVITDASAYGSLGIGSGDTVKVLLEILDPTGDVFYKNAGYDAGVFTSPDILPLTSATYSFTLPTDITGSYIQGSYTVNFKVQVTEGADITTGYAALYMDVCSCCNGVVADVRGEVSYNTAVVSVVDYTNYKTWTALTNTLSLYAPVGLSAVQTGAFHGSPATLTFEPPVGTYPYTGTWQWKLVSDITYTDAVTQTSTTCRITAQGSFEVLQSQLCKVRCLLDKYRTELYAEIRVKPNAFKERNYLMAESDYLMAFASERCALPQTTINKYITSIYTWTGIDPDCDCGCDEGVSQALVPTSIINGIDGTDGNQIYNGSGVPSGALGVITDYYIHINTGIVDLYQKTGASTWTFLTSMLGAAGAAGAAGANGVAILANQYPALSTLGTSYESLISNAAGTARTAWVLPANQLAANLDEITIYGSLITNAPSTTPLRPTRVLFNGNTVNGGLAEWSLGNGIAKIDYYVRVTRLTSTTARYEFTVKKYTAGGLGSSGYILDTEFSQTIVSLAGLDFVNNTYDIDVQGDSSTIGDITCVAFEVVYYKKS
jgi:hypothetical protein